MICDIIRSVTYFFLEIIFRLSVYEGVLDEDGTVTAWIMWTPEQAGLYYVETYVWDGMEALTSPGPVLLVLIN